MKILIVGLGLIGGSMARALKYFTEHTVVGFDTSREAMRKALLVGACDKVCDTLPELSDFDSIICAAYPAATVELLEQHAAEIKKGALVCDLGGTKRRVCDVGFAAAEKYGFSFFGGHPMAGTQFSGFEASRESLYKNATMLLMPPKDVDVRCLDDAVKLFKSVGFSSVRVTNADDHDRIVAYTSQLAHILSNAYVKSPTAREHRGYSAGSFRDLTRVAHLNAHMWSELFMENRDYLIPEVEQLAASLLEYSEAMKAGDADKLEKLLADGSRINDEIKEEI
ncbi:MAG: prephenate dehydrogenase [Clostridiales bacterium]|nr:prephenate dehydrogenase [Clostridiales bacterium]